MFDHFQFTLIHGPKIPGSCAILFFIASDFTSITNHIRNWALFLLSLHIPILSRVVSALFTSSISDTYWPGEFIFQWPIFLPFHTVHDLLKARILKWFAFLQWTTFCQNSPLWPVHLSWLWTARLIVSLSYASPFSMTKLWSMKGKYRYKKWLWERDFLAMSELHQNSVTIIEKTIW